MLGSWGPWTLSSPKTSFHNCGHWNSDLKKHRPNCLLSLWAGCRRVTKPRRDRGVGRQTSPEGSLLSCPCRAHPLLLSPLLPSLVRTTSIDCESLCGLERVYAHHLLLNSHKLWVKGDHYYPHVTGDLQESHRLLGSQGPWMLSGSKLSFYSCGHWNSEK